MSFLLTNDRALPYFFPNIKGNMRRKHVSDAAGVTVACAVEFQYSQLRFISIYIRIFDLRGFLALFTA